MKSKKHAMLYRFLIVLVILLSIITFTPVVIPYGIHEPTLFHMPYTLWTGLIVAVLYVTLTWLASRIHPGKEEDQQ